jgi:N6-L-threonylcarbamoyladenine synthase
MRAMRVLGIESSCDETGVALYDTHQGVMGQALHTQMAMHADYGGVVPELASRDHIRRVVPLTREVLAQAGCSLSDIDLIAYTQGPGLAGALLVGAATASGMALALGKPCWPVHHLEGHLLSPLLAEPKPSFPFVCLLVSGGHTQLIDVASLGDYKLLGDTVDDAAGEAFDKSAKLMDLGYPGGPALAAKALSGKVGRFKLPRPKLHSSDLDFSFSGLKTAVLTTLKREQLGASDYPDLCADIQEAIVDVLSAKCLKAVAKTGRKQLIVAGGVSANLVLRDRLQQGMKKLGGSAYFPPLSLCSDNGVMIAFAAHERAYALQQQGQDWQAHAQSVQQGFTVKPRWPLIQSFL